MASGIKRSMIVECLARKKRGGTVSPLFRKTYRNVQQHIRAMVILFTYASGETAHGRIGRCPPGGILGGD